MQTAKWDDLRVGLAVARTGTLAAAARELGVDDTTVARRLAAAQATIGARLYERLSDGTLRLTRAGERAALAAERIVREIDALGGALPRASEAIAGVVRITSVPIVANHILVPSAPALLRRHPRLRLDIVADARNLSLTRREADLALRLARPKTGGTRVMARRVGRLRYAAYAAASCPPREAAALPWITYDESLAHLPQARWIAAAVRAGAAVAALGVTDAETLIAAVAAGVGRSLLPCCVADRDARLRRLETRRQGKPIEEPTGKPTAPLPTRELWLLAHADLRKLARIEAVVAWIGRIAPR